MEAYWVTTQRMLQPQNDPIVRRPKLTEALLRRPPFRFLHDVISEVTRKTGFTEGLFTGEELTDKDARLEYLSKIINCVAMTLNASVPVRPAKILAGLEPEQTNIFLQMLAQAATSDPQEARKAVERCLSGEVMQPCTQRGDRSDRSALSTEKLRRAMYSTKIEANATPIEVPSTAPQEVNFPEQPKEAQDLVVEVPTEENERGPCGLQQGPGLMLGNIPSSDDGVEVSRVHVIEEKEFIHDPKQEEIQRLRQGIQALCQGISPLGKSIDYLQEDAEAMVKEYKYWIKEQQSYASKLEQEQKKTENLLQEEAGKVQELKDEIKLQEERSHMLKAEIFRNEDAVFSLLMAASTSKASSMPNDTK